MIYQEITKLLENGGCGKFGEVTFWSLMPNKPDTLCTVYQYAGEGPTTVKEIGVAGRAEWVYPRFQVVTRALTYSGAMALAMQAHAALDGFCGEIEGGFYDSIRSKQYPFDDPGGKDDAGRTRVICNFGAKRRPD